MNEILVRPMAERDFEEIAVLLAELAGYAHSTFRMDFAQVQKVYSAMLSCPQQYKNMVACLQGRVAGFISVVYYLSFFHKGGTALINELIVSAEHRRSGIGRALVQKAALVAKEDGLDEIEVGTEPTNAIAVKFYKEAGFNQEYVLLGMEFDS
jgi:ribosomal protein S18 acetylase RimI-like enzyme